MQTLDQEVVLCNTLEHAGREYARAIAEIDSLTLALVDGREFGQTALQLQRVAVRTRDTESQVSRGLEQWKSSPRVPGRRLREVMAHQERLLRELIERFDKVERIACEARDHLRPRIDASTQSREMRSAYARSVRLAAD